MELNVANRARRTEALFKSEAASGQAGAVRTPLSQTPTPVRSDKLSLTGAGLAFVEAQKRQTTQLLAERKAKSRESEDGDALLNALEKGVKTLDKCQKIASRITKGDKVPPEDLLYLMKHDMAGYRMALASRKPAKDPKVWKSVLDDEDRAELSSGEVSCDFSSRGTVGVD